LVAVLVLDLGRQLDLVRAAGEVGAAGEQATSSRTWDIRSPLSDDADDELGADVLGPGVLVPAVALHPLQCRSSARPPRA
jgi:hypothetical protein